MLYVKTMKTVTIKSLYLDFLQVPFPIELAGRTIDDIDLSLFDTELAGLSAAV